MLKVQVSIWSMTIWKIHTNWIKANLVNIKTLSLEGRVIAIDKWLGTNVGLMNWQTHNKWHFSDIGKTIKYIPVDQALKPLRPPETLILGLWFGF